MFIGIYLKMLKKFASFLMVLQFIFANSALSEDYYYRKNVCYKDWVYGVMPHPGICSAENFSEFYCFDQLPKEKAKTVSQSFKISEDGLQLYKGRAVISLRYVPNAQIFSAALTSGDLNLIPGRYTALFVFDDRISIKMIGYVERPRNDRPIFTTPESQIIYFEHKEFLREIVPRMKKHKNVAIIVEGNRKLPSSSLMGFSKAYNDMRQCMGEAVTYELKDPF